MNYSEILRRSWNIVWEHKFLILLGIIVALSGSSSSGGASGSGRSVSQWAQTGEMDLPDGWGGAIIPPDAIAPLRGFGLPAVSALVLAAVAGLAVAVGVAIWVASTLARGALISGANDIDAGRATDLGATVAAAWRRGWRLLGIALVPALPALVLAIGGIVAAVLYLTVAEVTTGPRIPAGPNVIWIGLAILVTLLILAAVFVLEAVREFANRACMLEECGLVAAYKRGARVLVDHIGPAIVLFLIQIGISLGLLLVLLMPALCCILWPVLLAVQGTASAFFSTAWTLAWREWTGLATGAAVSLE